MNKKKLLVGAGLILAATTTGGLAQSTVQQTINLTATVASACTIDAGTGGQYINANFAYDLTGARQGTAWSRPFAISCSSTTIDVSLGSAMGGLRFQGPTLPGAIGVIPYSANLSGAFGSLSLTADGTTMGPQMPVTQTGLAPSGMLTLEVTPTSQLSAGTQGGTYSDQLTLTITPRS